MYAGRKKKSDIVNQSKLGIKTYSVNAAIVSVIIIVHFYFSHGQAGKNAVFVIKKFRRHEQSHFKESSQKHLELESLTSSIMACSYLN